MSLVLAEITDPVVVPLRAAIEAELDLLVEERFRIGREDPAAVHRCRGLEPRVGAGPLSQSRPAAWWYRCQAACRVIPIARPIAVQRAPAARACRTRSISCLS